MSPRLAVKPGEPLVFARGKKGPDIEDTGGGRGDQREPERYRN